MRHWKVKIHILSEELFKYSLLTYLLLLLVETFKEGFVSFFFNFNILLVVVLFAGVGMVLTYEEKYNNAPEIHKLTSADVQNGIVYASVGALLVYFNTLQLDAVAYILASLTGCIIFLLTLLISTD